MQVSINFLKGLMRREFTGKPVKGGETIDLGGGHALEFVMAPNLHWPDSMFSFDSATNIMYTCDAFGSHYCTEDPWDTDVQVSQLLLVPTAHIVARHVCVQSIPGALTRPDPDLCA